MLESGWVEQRLLVAVSALVRADSNRPKRKTRDSIATKPKVVAADKNRPICLKPDVVDASSRTYPRLIALGQILG